MRFLANQTITGVVKEMRLVLTKKDDADNMKVKITVLLIITGLQKKSMVKVIKMWKSILKISMDEARELGRKYAPEDMRIADEEKDFRETLFQIERQRKILNKAKENLKNVNIPDDGERYVLEGFIEKMEKSLGTFRFIIYLEGFKNFLKTYDRD